MNGILNTSADAEQSRQDLSKLLLSSKLPESLVVKVGYNATHVAGITDKIESVTQTFAKPISDYDLDTILMQIQPEVTTRKILLVGHSQGSFYTDEMYDYLTTHGVPKESIAVYNIATPESFVGGGGGYITSTNDKVINAVRDAENNGNLQIYLNSYYVQKQHVVDSALRANVTIPKEDGWDADSYGGHHFSVYLGGAADRIVSDIDRELENLQASGGDSADACFTAPTPTLTYNAQKALLTFSDPAADIASGIGTTATAGVLALAQNINGALATVFGHATGQTAAAVVPFDNLNIQTLNIETSPSASTKNIATPNASVVATVNQPAPPSPQAPSNTPSNALQQPGLFPVTPGFGGGGSQSQNAQTNTTPPNITAALTVTSPQDGTALATTSVIFAGTADAGASIISTSGADLATTTADSSGNWSLTLTLPEGTASVSTTATSAGQTSSTDTRSITVDITPPSAPVLSVAACSASLLAGSCLLATTTVEVTWPAAPGATYYALVKNGVVGATSTALTSSAIISSGATTSIAVVAYDEAGNAATSSALDIAAVAQPLTINEVGWGGTDTDPTNQWIELKNMTSDDIDLSNIVLTRSGGASIPLSGTLLASPNGSFLVIAPGSTTFFGAHTLSAAFSLATTSAEQLSLVWNGSTIFDTTPPVAACSAWCAGSYSATLGTNVGGHANFTTPLSMERKSNTDGTTASSWQNNDSYVGLPGEGTNVAFWGTPGTNNSAGLPDAGVYCGSKNNLLTPSAPPGPAFSPGNDCVFLTRFITPGTLGAPRFGGVFRGDVASSTGAGQHISLAFDMPVNIAALNPAPGEHFFFAMWEETFGNDTPVFNFYFTQGASTTQGITGPPHGNYVTVPFTYQP